MAIVTLFYNGSEEEGRANFKKFFDLGMCPLSVLPSFGPPLMHAPGPVADQTHEIPYEELNGILNANVVPGRKVYMACKSWIS